MLIVVKEEEEEVKVRHNYTNYALCQLLFINPDGGKDIAGIVVGVIFGVIVITNNNNTNNYFCNSKTRFIWSTVILSKNGYEMLMYNIISGIM